MTRVAGIVLAAGPSRRFGHHESKQVVRLDGEPLVRRVARTALASRLDRVLVVVGHESATVSAVLAGLAVELVDNPAYGEGQSTSVRAGLSRLGAETEAAMFVPADQPAITSELIDRLIERFEETDAWVVTPVHAGRRGAPALVGRPLFERMAAITGDEGGRQLFSELPPDRLAGLEIDDPSLLTDVDVPDDLAGFRLPS